MLTQHPWEIRLMGKWRQNRFGVACDVRRPVTHAERTRYGMTHDMGARESAKPFPEAFFRAMELPQRH